MQKFSCPVSMQVTHKQYEKDLKQGLLDLGYVEKCLSYRDSHNIMLTNNLYGEMGEISNINKDSISDYDRHFIDHYNPELFLALAAMREGEEPYPGEYFKVISDDMELYHLKKNHLYKVKHTDRSNNLTYGYLNKNYRKHLYRKATKEEVINWFSSPGVSGETFTITLNKEHFANQKYLEEFCEELNSSKIVITIPYKKEYHDELEKVINSKDSKLGGVKICSYGISPIEETPEPNSDTPLTSKECHKFRDELDGYTAEAWEAAKPKTLKDPENWVITNGLNTTYDATGYVDPYKAEGTSLEDVHVFSKGHGYSSMTFGRKEGFKDSKEKLNYELDWHFIEAMAKRMSSNKSVYPPYNWKKPMDIENLKQALFRHVIEIMKGNYDDDGMERAHFMSVALNAMMIDYQLRNNNNKTNE